MADIKKIRRAVLGALLSIAGLGIFTACYGVPEYYYSNDKVLSGTVTDESGNPVNGIQVSVDGNRFATTDDHGRFSNFVISDKFDFEVLFQDVDGEKNGGLFEEKSLSVTVPAEGFESLSVTLRKVR
ncbi:MAG: radical SAM-associated putative lipoprotein [Bacteroidales bacterium]|nr:radical SAM-associated putative lipoprotein [Bacteroidales bacterium]